MRSVTPYEQELEMCASWIYMSHTSGCYVYSDVWTSHSDHAVPIKWVFWKRLDAADVYSLIRGFCSLHLFSVLNPQNTFPFRLMWTRVRASH